MSQIEILELFDEYGLDSSQKSNIETLEDICREYNLDAETLSDKWLQFTLNNKIEEKINTDLISRFKIEGLKKLKRAAYLAMPKPNFNQHFNAKITKKDVYASPAIAFASPASESFSKRTDKGKILTKLGDEIIEYATDEANVKRCNNYEEFNYMEQKLNSVADIVIDHISDRINLMMDKLDIEDLLPLNTITQESVTLLGMILIENDEIFLATDVEEVKLDIQTLGEFEFYSGLHCALVGTNPTGKAFVVDEVKSFNFNETVKDEDGTEKQIQNTSILVSCGPYFTTDSLSNDPINELVTKIKETKPNLAILVAPFLDEKHPGVRRGEIGVREISSLLAEKVSEIENSGCRVILMSSPKDFIADPIYPTPKISSSELQRVENHLAGDPSYLTINGWNIAITSNDVSMQMIHAERNFVKNSKRDKFTRIGEHLIAADTLMPINPVPLGVSLDYDQISRIQFPENFVPDIILTPSDLQPFARFLSNKSLFVNPGRLTKGKGGGSYAFVQFNSKGHKIQITKI